MWLQDGDALKVILSENPEVVLEFTAPAWCSPCQKLAPHLDKVAENSSALILAVDIDKFPEIAQKFNVMSVPTLMLYRDGSHVKNLKERSAVRLLAEINES